MVKKRPQESSTKSRNYSNKSKIKRTKSRINYYANCVANLALSDDIELNPGPGSSTRNNTPKCSLCNKGVVTNRKRLQCSQYRNLTHITCSNIPKTEKKHYTARTVYAWLCSDCTLSTLLFYQSKDLVMSLYDDTDSNVPLSQNKHHQKLNEQSKLTPIAHFNIQAIMSAFNEFAMMFQECQFDIVALIDTWLHDCSFQQNYVQINGYNSVFRNRKDKRGGDVGVYIKESITYKVRHDLSKGHDNLETLFVEIGGRNKNTPSRICVAYQPSSNEIEKLEWLENFEKFLADVYLN